MNISDVLVPITEAQPGAALALLVFLTAGVLGLVGLVVWTVVGAVREKNDSTTYDRIVGLIRVSRRTDDEDPRS
ncbi:hypothetical protein [Rhodococcus sp. NPDC003383]